MKGNTFSSVGKALDILNLFNLKRREFSANEISKELGIPLSSTYKYIEVLLKRGFLARTPGTKMVCLGLMIFRMGIFFEANYQLSDMVSPYMTKMAEETGETIILTAVQEFGAICIKGVEPDRLIKLSFESGRILPLHVSATSKVLLAYQSNDFIDNYIENIISMPDNKYPQKSPSKLIKQIKDIRSKGYAYSLSEVDSGASAVASPIFDVNGNLLAGIAVAGPADRIDKKTLKKHIDLVIRNASQISVDFGYIKTDT